MSYLTPLTNPNNLDTPGDTVLASDWSTDWSSIVNYINTYLVGSWNIFQNAGDILAYTGSAVVNIPVGANGQFLQANSGSTGGVQWASAAALATLTTNGDTLYYNSGNTRLPIGSAGEVLTVSSGGLPVWSGGSLPIGAIVLWSGTIATIPANWALCDGVHNASGVNLQGYFLVGAGNQSPAGTNGMGLIAPNTQGGDASSGTGKGATYTINGAQNGGEPSFQLVGGVSGNGPGTTTTVTVTPVWYALCYIEFQGA